MQFRNLKENNAVKKFYKFLFYAELGRGTSSRFYGWLPETLIIIGGLKYLFDITFSKVQLCIIFISMIIVFFLAGYWLKKSGLYDADRVVQTSKDPIMSEILERLRKK